MITSEQKVSLTEFLSTKNLPLDLWVEVLDHISEQVDYKMLFENKDFNTAFSETKISWQDDLKMNRHFAWEKSRTKIYRETVWNSNIEVGKKSLFYFTFYFIISIGLMLYNKTIASSFVFTIYCFAVIVFLVYFIFNYKIIRTVAGNRMKKDISYMQGATQLFQMSSIFIITMVLFNFESRFDKYYNFISGLKSNFHLTQVGVGSFIIFNLFALVWIYGFLYFQQYKKSIKYLQQKINLKL